MPQVFQINTSLIHKKSEYRVIYVLYLKNNRQMIPQHNHQLIGSVVSSINKKACLLACLLENSTKFTQPLILETYSKPF